MTRETVTVDSFQIERPLLSFPLTYARTGAHTYSPQIPKNKETFNTVMTGLLFVEDSSLYLSRYFMTNIGA